MTDTSRSWLTGKRAALVLTFDVDAESAILAESSGYARHAMVMSHQRFGPTVGVPRILGLLAELEVTGTFFIPGLTVDRYPHAVDAIIEAGHEVGHHSYSHRTSVSMTAEEERSDFERALTSLARHNISPRGYRSPLWEIAWRTPDLLLEYGLEYDSSLMDDDRPYILETDRGQLVELPPHWSLDDWEQYAYLPQPRIGTVIETPSKVLDLWTWELEAMRDYGGLVMLTSHPFLTGRAGRLEVIRRLVQHARELGDVEILTAGEAALRARADTSLPIRRFEQVELEPGMYPS